MSTELKDGGQVTAMSLRDHFAGLAMQGILQGVIMDRGAEEAYKRLAEDHKIEMFAAISLESYAQADAMLAERAKGAK